MVWKVEAENFEQKARRGQESNTEQPSSNPNWAARIPTSSINTNAPRRLTNPRGAVCV